MDFTAYLIIPIKNILLLRYFLEFCRRFQTLQDRPDEDLRLYVYGGGSYLGRVVEDIDRGLFEKRSNEKRPFSSPVSLDPVLARVLVNLSGVEAGEHLLDPFCGTGGILIEAGLCGVGVYGFDVKEEMVEGARENLEEYGVIVHDIRQRDALELDDSYLSDIDAVVTDLPYGRSSVQKYELLEEFLVD